MLHLDMNSATGIRARRKAETTASLISIARALTAEHGLAGFTIEELCEQAGISRRTFFNYFASKERAVLGVADRLDHADLDEHFVSTTGPVVDAFADLFIARWERMELVPAEFPALHAAMDREPRLVVQMLELASENEREDARLVERRENLPVGDLHAQLVVQLMGTILRTAMFEMFNEPTTDPFPDIFARRLAAARAVFS